MSNPSHLTHAAPVVAPSVLDALVYPNETAAGLAAAVPQGLLVEALVELTPSLLSVDGRIDALIAVERHIALLQARSSELLSALETGDSTEDHFTRDAVAAALRLPPASMKDRMTSAQDLCERLPATLELLRAGEISQYHTVVLVDAIRGLPGDQAAAVETAVLGEAPRQTATQFRASVKKAVLRVTDPVTEADAHKDAVTQRRVIFKPGDDGMSEMWAFLPADSAAVIKATLDAMAHKTIHLPGGDDRTADQRRADALVDLARSKLCDTKRTNTGPTDTGPTDTGPTDTGPTDTAQPSPATATTDDPAPADGADRDAVRHRSGRGHGQRPAVQVTIAASTLMGLDDQRVSWTGTGRSPPPWPAGSPPTRPRRGDGCSPTTTATSCTPAQGYHPTAGMTATVLARDQHCTFPGCRRASRYNDLDHITAWREGDETTTANLGSVCRRHHRLKHTSAWQVERDDATGVTTWTDHRGRTYTSRPPDLPTTPTGPQTPRTPSASPPATTADGNPDLPPF